MSAHPVFQKSQSFKSKFSPKHWMKIAPYNSSTQLFKIVEAILKGQEALLLACTVLQMGQLFNYHKIYLIFFL